MGLRAEKFKLLDPGLGKTFERGAAITLKQYLEAANARGALGVRMKKFHETYDLLLTPSLAVLPFTAGKLVPDGMGDAYWTAWTPFSRSEEHTSELQSLMRISYAVFCLTKKTKKHQIQATASTAYTTTQ